MPSTFHSSPFRRQWLAFLGALALVAGPSASAFDSDAERCFAWVAMRSAHQLEANPHACVQKARDALDVLIMPRASIEERGADFDADVVVWLGSGAETLVVRIEGSGALAAASNTFESTEGWESGDAFDFPIHVARTEGRGSLLVHTTALGVDGEPLHGAAAEVFVYNEGNVTWWSRLGHADLGLARAAALAANGQLDAAQLQAAREAALGAVAATTTAPARERSSLHIEEEFERAFAVHREAAETGNARPPVAEAVVSDVTVKGAIRWADSMGTLQGAAFATVEVRDKESIGSELVATTLTDSLGNYEVTFDHDDGDGEGPPDLFVRAIARSVAATVGPTKDPDDAYFVDSAGDPREPAAGETLTFNLDLADAANDAHLAFSVHTGLVWIAWYAGELAGLTPSQLPVMFPAMQSGMDASDVSMGLVRLDRYDWDLIFHEYGHYVALIHGLMRTPGGFHKATLNMWAERGDKSEGLRLAWGEGWATFFSIAGQTSAGLISLGVPNVGDIRYTDTEDSMTDYSLEVGDDAGPGLGEDNELSVMTFMWDLFDGQNEGLDKTAFTDSYLFNVLRQVGVETLGDTWEAIADGADDEGKAEIGGALSQARVAPELLEPSDNIEAGATPPTFKWKKHGAGTPNPLNDFRIVFFKNDFSSKILEKELGDVDTYTPTAPEWTTVLEGDAIVKWVVQGRNTVSPVSPSAGETRYWSAARTIGSASVAFVIDDTESMEEEIDAVTNALQNYVDLVESELEEDETPPTIQVITFKDDVTTRAISNDLGVIRSVVGNLFASSGDDCPEYSSQALERAADAVAKNGTILFATDASSHPGIDTAALIAKLRAKSITVNTILSGGCLDFGDAARASNGFTAAEAQGENEPSVPIDDPGQPAIDVHGNTLESATRLVVGGASIPARVVNSSTDPDNPDREDWFVVALEEGVSYVIEHSHVSGEGAQVFIRDATTRFGFGNVGATRPDHTLFTPAETRDYHIQVFASPGAAYRLSVTDDPLAGLYLEAIDLYSTISEQTGGIFLLREEVNIFDTEPYEAAVFNVMATTVRPGVLAANPRQIPRNAEVGVTLRGGNTNWRSGTQVAFSGGDISVKSVNVLSPTTLVATVETGAFATLDARDVTVSTPLGGGTENAPGTGVVEVILEPFRATTISVEPAILARDTSETILVRGVMTNWQDGASVEILNLDGYATDPLIGVVDVNVLSKTLLEVDVVVGQGAALGFRTLAVTSGGETVDRDRAVLIQTGSIGIPEVDAVLPSSGTPGETLEVGVDASLTHFEQGLTTASFGPGVEVLSVSVDSETSATVEVAIDAEAEFGFRDVVMTTGEEAAALIDGYFVGEPVGVNILPDNGKFSGCLFPGSEVLFSFEVPVNRKLHVVTLEGIKVSGGGLGKLKNAELVLIDPRDDESRLGKLKKKKVTQIKRSNTRLPLAGEHFLAIRATDAKGGCFKGKAKVRPSDSSVPFRGCLGPAEETELFFTAETDSSIVKLLVEGAKRKTSGKLDPQVTLEAPSAGAQMFEAASGKRVVVKDEPLGEAGDWAIRVTGREGATGCFEGKLKVQQGSAP